MLFSSVGIELHQQVCKVIGFEPDIALLSPKPVLLSPPFFGFPKIQMLEWLWSAASRTVTRSHSLIFTTWLEILYSTVHAASNKRNFGPLIVGGQAGRVKISENCGQVVRVSQDVIARDALTWWGCHFPTFLLTLQEIRIYGGEIDDEMEDEFYMQRLEAGLFTLQLVDYIMLEICQSGVPSTVKWTVPPSNDRILALPVAWLLWAFPSVVPFEANSFFLCLQLSFEWCLFEIHGLQNKPWWRCGTLRFQDCSIWEPCMLTKSKGMAAHANASHQLFLLYS